MSGAAGVSEAAATPGQGPLSAAISIELQRALGRPGQPLVGEDVEIASVADDEWRREAVARVLAVLNLAPDALTDEAMEAARTFRELSDVIAAAVLAEGGGHP